MPPLPTVTPRQIIRALERAGFVFQRQRGSHRLYMLGERVVVIPFHTKDVRKGTLKNIIGQSGLSLENFLELL